MEHDECEEESAHRKNVQILFYFTQVLFLLSSRAT